MIGGQQLDLQWIYLKEKKKAQKGSYISLPLGALLVPSNSHPGVDPIWTCQNKNGEIFEKSPDSIYFSDQKKTQNVASKISSRKPQPGDLLFEARLRLGDPKLSSHKAWEC